jgi:hypothetical protein
VIAESAKSGFLSELEAIAFSGTSLDAQMLTMVEKPRFLTPSFFLEGSGQGRAGSAVGGRSDGAVLPVGRGKLTALLLPSLSTARTPKK